MNVKALVTELQKLDQNLDVLCCTEDVELLTPGHSLRVLEIESVERIVGKRDRDEANAPVLLQTDSEDETSKVACLWVTSHM